MSDNVVQVSIRGDASSLSSATKEAGSAMGGLTGALKEWRTHVRTESRYTNFLAMQVSGLGIASKGAAAEITGLVSAFAFGGVIGVGIDLVKMAAHAFHDVEEAAAASKEAMKKWGDELVAGTEKVKKWSDATLMALRGASRAEQEAHTEIKPLLEERAKLEQAIAVLQSNVAEAADRQAADEFDAMQRLGGEEEKDLARKREALDLINKQIAARQQAIGAVATEQIGQDVEKEGEDEADRLKRVEKLRQDHLMRVSKAEFEAAKAIQKMNDENLKYRQDRLVAEENIEDEIRGLEAKAIKERFDALKQQVHEAAGEGTRMGAVFGTAFAGIADGTMSVTKAFASMAHAALRVIIDQVRKAIEAYALQAAAAAAAANAGIPLAGLFIAAAAAAAMEAMVMGLLGSLPSAAVGMPRVPADMPVMVHRDEAILTKGQAEDWRGGGGGGVTHNHYWQAVDAQSVERFVNGPDFERAFAKAQHYGRIK